MTKLDRRRILQHSRDKLRLLHYHSPDQSYPRRLPALYLLLALIAPVPWTKLRSYLVALFGKVDEVDGEAVQRNAMCFGVVLDCLEECETVDEEEEEDLVEWLFKFKDVCRKL
ncbi:hypothetical protein BT69DRAFT_1275698 [Atractiella rhizophila]|nr:hypothetical protein BT69DRAFT_1275698 [Atractiella rhizophila]